MVSGGLVADENKMFTRNNCCILISSDEAADGFGEGPW